MDRAETGRLTERSSKKAIGSRVGSRLARWYAARRRDLPWRGSRDPYAIWVSEVMLQQTTVAVAVPRFSRFLLRFPDVATLAHASEWDVMAEWSGLGYYARARNLKKAAEEIAALGEFPRTAAALVSLPGIGPYTAAAVASIAFGEPVAVVDGNVARVLARLFRLAVDPRSPSDLARLRLLATELLFRRNPGDHNQAMMELGATVCLPRAPACPICPLRPLCAARLTGGVHLYPAMPKTRPVQRLRLAAGLAYRRGHLVLVEDGLLVKGHLSAPMSAVAAGQEPADVLLHAWRALTNRAARELIPLGVIKHSVLERRYEVSLFRVVEGPRTNGSPPVPAVHLVAPAEILQQPHGGLLRKILARVT